MMKYLYTGEYSVGEVKPGGSISHHDCGFRPLEVYKLADFVLMPKLKQLAVKPMEKWFQCFSRSPAIDDHNSRTWKLWIPVFVKKVYAATNYRRVMDGRRLSW